MSKICCDRSHLHLLTLTLSHWESSNTPEDIRQKINEIIELCDEYIGKGYTYQVIEDEKGEIDIQEVPIL